jgi:KaiC/GvpD/RAD55 family RecA-like ATPase
MAYISTEEVKVIREELKKNFPSRLGWKLSVVRRDYLSLSISIINAPIELRNDQNNAYESVNQYWLESRQNKSSILVLKKILEIANKNNYDRSDVQSDYFDVGYYLNLSIGHFGKPFNPTV